MSSIRSSLLVVSLVAVAVTLGACGKKGPLYLPEERPASTAEPHKAPPTESDAARP